MTIVFDNYNNNYPQLKSLWGFSAYLEKYHLLFDTGCNGCVLRSGDRAIAMFTQSYDERYIQGGIGAKIKL